MLAGTTDILTQDAFCYIFYPDKNYLFVNFKTPDSEPPQLHTSEQVTDLGVTKLILNLNTVL